MTAAEIAADDRSITKIHNPELLYLGVVMASPHLQPAQGKRKGYQCKQMANPHINRRYTRQMLLYSQELTISKIWNRINSSISAPEIIAFASLVISIYQTAWREDHEEARHQSYSHHNHIFVIFFFVLVFVQPARVRSKKGLIILSPSNLNFGLSFSKLVNEKKKRKQTTHGLLICMIKISMEMIKIDPTEL